jgi:hypothetical protein
MARYRVTEGTQIHHAGVTYAGGETLTVDAPATVEVNEAVKRWLAAGWVEPAPTSRKKK